tara:strand:+ start:486 stop:926 length:441 start_codon:yes stop_codon:yes gene_type:complete
MSKDDICKKYGLDPERTNVEGKGHFWLHNQSKKECITFEGVEKMIDYHNIKFQLPDKNYSDKEGEVALLIYGCYGEGDDFREAWSFGEASPDNCGYISYTWAMAEKRGKMRVALKLLGIYGGSSGFYSDVEMEIAQKYENDNDHGL